MFKFARYFFFVFVITTITPLLLLFFWNYQHITSFKKTMEEHIVGDELNKIKNVVEQYESFDEIDFEKIRPAGPFSLEVYRGIESNEAKLAVRYMPDFSRIPPPPPPPPFLLPGDDPPHPPIPDITHFLSKSFIFTGNNGTDKALFVLKFYNHPNPGFLTGQMIEPGIVILFAGLIFSLIAGFYLNNNFVKPLIIISEGSKKILQGDLSFRAKILTKQPEIKETLENFNVMVQKLKEKEELKAGFIENMTHDLRTPLHAQERALELLAEEFRNVGMDEQFKLAKGLEKNNKHLLRMVNLILQSYRIDSEDINIKISDINLNTLVDDCYEKLSFMANEKNIMLLNNIPEDFPVIKTDLTCLKRIFINLVSNSIDNIPKERKIEINAADKNDYIEVVIEDNGQGISGKDMEHLFDRYYSGKTDERKIGSGLGLYVCKRLVKVLQGEIFVESEQDKFTRFTIKLPRGK